MSDSERAQGDRDDPTKARTDSEAALQEELRREAAEGEGAIGDVAKNRNLSGSSTWETLPDPPSSDDSAQRPDSQ